MPDPQRPKHPFGMRGYIAALSFAGVVLFIFGLALDALLRLMGIGVVLGIEAFWSAFLGTVCSFFIARLFWRMGLVTLPQYMVGAFAVMTPIAIISFVPLSQLIGAQVDMPWLGQDVSDDHAIALTVYLRLGRAAVLVPIYLMAFYWYYHIHLWMAPKRYGDP